jgi:hypothetical protein
MKTLLLPFFGSLLGSMIFCSCAADKEIQAEIVYVELVKIDTINRFHSDARQLLTWRDEKKVDYITYESLEQPYSVGSKLKMIVRR